MSELETIKLNPENQLLLETASLRIPYELSRRNLKQAQKHIEKERDYVLGQLKTLTSTVAAGGQPIEKVEAQIDSMITHMTALKKKLEDLEVERKKLHKQAEARIRHVAELWEVPTVADVKYEAWSKVRLDRLMVDYMLRKGYTESAKLLAQDRGIEDLVDVELFTSAQKVAAALRNGSLSEALAWCSEHKPLMKSMKTSPSNPNLKATSAAQNAWSDLNPSLSISPDPLTATTAPPPSATSLEFQLRLQQCINLLFPPLGSTASPDVLAARAHMVKYLSPHSEDALHKADVRAAAMLLIIPPSEAPLRYAGYYSQARWNMLSELFIATFLELWGLPRDAGLKRALQAGLTALKTPSCHPPAPTAQSVDASTSKRATRSGEQMAGVISGEEPSRLDRGKSSSDSVAKPTTSSQAGTVPGTRLCPICSTELNSLAKDLPYAHHSQSLVDPDPVVLPNDRIYGRSKLKEFAEKMGVVPGMVKDPVTGEEYAEAEMHKVFIL